MKYILFVKDLNSYCKGLITNKQEGDHLTQFFKVITH